MLPPITHKLNECLEHKQHIRRNLGKVHEIQDEGDEHDKVDYSNQLCAKTVSILPLPGKLLNAKHYILSSQDNHAEKERPLADGAGQKPRELQISGVRYCLAMLRAKGPYSSMYASH